MNAPDKHPTTPVIQLDCWKLIQHFGGLSKTSKLMREYGIPVSVDVIEKWRRRGSVPSAQLITLAAIAKARGLRFDLYDFILEKNNDESDQPGGAEPQARAVVRPGLGSEGTRRPRGARRLSAASGVDA
jgi:hypothetical protein